jgi:hypothetical protein
VLSFIHPSGDYSTGIGEDFSEGQLGDPWDMSSADDIDLVSGFHPDSTTWQNGVFRSVTGSTDPFVQWQPSVEINAGTYQTISFRMFLDDPSDRPLQAIVYWFVDGQWNHSDFIPATEGWQIHSVDLAAFSTWTGSIPLLRIDPVALAGVVVGLDWVRLTVPNSASFTVVWEDHDPDDDATIDLVASAGSWLGSSIIVGQGLHEDSAEDHLAWDVSSLPEDYYFIRALLDDGINRPDTVFAPHPLVVGAPAVPPVTLSGRLDEPSTLSLAWSSPTGQVTEYRVYRAPQPHFSPSPVRLIATVPFWETGYIADLGEAAANPDIDYFFRVTWLSGGTESPPSNTVGEYDQTTQHGEPGADWTTREP